MESVYVCSNCRYESPLFLSGCPACGQGWFNKKEAGAADSGPPPAFAGAARVCYKCDFETARGDLTNCPRCKHKLMAAGSVKVLGWALLGLGAFLVVLMGSITFLVAGIIARTGEPGSTQSFSGGPKELALIFGIFGLVIAFGLASIVAGFSQARSGRRSKMLVKVMMGIFVALVVVGGLIQALL